MTRPLWPGRVPAVAAGVVVAGVAVAPAVVAGVAAAPAVAAADVAAAGVTPVAAAVASAGRKDLLYFDPAPLAGSGL